ncbi:MAG: hypothetical protein AAF329_09080 [Cyanobacteria bacterium P01_A01_bin.17]
MGLWQEFLPTDDSGGAEIHSDFFFSFVFFSFEKRNRPDSFISSEVSAFLQFAVGYSEKIFGHQYPSAEFMGFVRSVSATTERYSQDDDVTLPPLFKPSDVPVEVVHYQMNVIVSRAENLFFYLRSFV